MPGELAGVAVRGDHQVLERVRRLSLLVFEGEAADVDVGRHQHVRPAEQRRLLSHEVGHAQRDAVDLVGRVEGVLEHRVARPGRARDLLVGGGVVALAGPDLDALHAAELDLDLAERAVAGRIGGVVADEVVHAGLVGDALETAGEVVRVADGEAAAVGGQRLGALGGLERLREGRADVLRGEGGV